MTVARFILQIVACAVKLVKHIIVVNMVTQNPGGTKSNRDRNPSKMPCATVLISMKFISAAFLSSAVLLSSLPANVSNANAGVGGAQSIFGFRDAVAENAIESRFLAVPDPKLAEEHLRILTQAPHMAGTVEDKATADYVAQKFRDAGLDTEIVEYKVWINYPAEISVDVTEPPSVKMHGPTREHVDGDPFDNDPRIVTPFNGMSPSGDAEADVVYANYGTPDDFEKLDKLKIDVRGKIVVVRYGQNFRGVKVFVAQEHGAAAVIIYSDPSDDGWKRGDKYPAGPWRPDTGVQRAGRRDTCSNFPETRRRRESHPSRRCRSRNEFLRSNRRRCRRFP